ncbi:hypothetical protein [Mesorhizobium marinum]|uniref:Uncharacterized protein n=1 Tax=Mesorhizobium marinum TaxID=3228790 RepID=A0ABV3QYQ8_9HYPH
MRTMLVLACAMGLSVSVASADCAAHAKVTTAVDTETTVASVLPAQPVKQSTKAEEPSEAE